MMRAVIYLLVLGGGFCISAPSEMRAQGGLDKRGNIQEKAPAHVLAALARGPEVLIEGQTYVLLTEARAVRAQHSGEASAQALTRLKLPGRSVLERKGIFVIYQDAAPGRVPSGPATSPESLPVLINKQTGAMAIAVGTIRVKLHSLGDANNIARDHGLTVSNQFPHLKTAFFEAATGTDLAALSQALASDPRVDNAGLELIERVLSPR